MENIVEAIKKIPNLFKTKGVDNDKIIEAEKQLNLEFSDEYKDYLKFFGAISFNSVEITGLNVGNYINVVDVTKKERIISSSFPLDCIVIENIGNEGILIIQNKKSEIFEYFNGTTKKMHDSLADYLAEISMKQ